MDKRHCRYKDLESISKMLYTQYFDNMRLRLKNIGDLYSQSCLINGYSGVVLAHNLLLDIYET